MPTVYERVVDGRVVERVQPVPDDFEDTRLGVSVLEVQEAAERGETLTEYWRVESQDPFTSAPDDQPDEPETPAAEPAIPSPAEPADEPDDAAPARPATTRKE